MVRGIDAMTLQGELCFRLSKMLMKAPSVQGTDLGCYGEWRFDEMARSWSHFSDQSVANKDVLDFGCGDGPLSLFLALTTQPRSIIGVDLDARAVDRATASIAHHDSENLSCVPEFRLGEAGRIPIPDSSVDAVLAFDCMEHIMEPSAIMAEWRRVLRPGGRVLIEWFPFKGPWGPHMHNLIPIPWAHVLFGEHALFEAAERLYDDPDYVPRHWDYDECGARRPNRWREVRRICDAGYLNMLDVGNFRRIATEGGFRIDRLEAKALGAHGAKRVAGQLLLAMPMIGEYATNFIVAELEA